MMTKQEVLQGALALNCSDKKYTISVEGDKIIIEANYQGSGAREATFRCTAKLKDDQTYTVMTYHFDGHRKQYGVYIKAASYGLDGSKEVFDSKEVTQVLRDYLHSCGYQRVVNKKLIALCVSIPVAVIAIILMAILIPSTLESDFVDTNGPDNFALTEITQAEILQKRNNYTSSVGSAKHSGKHTKIVGEELLECDYDYVSKDFRRLHGVVVFHATKISENTLTLNINSSVESGNAEIVILVDGKYHCSVDVNQAQSVTLQGISNQEVIVKLAGEGAKIKIDVTRVY